MPKNSVSVFILTTLFSMPMISYATQYPLTVTDLDGRTITLQHEPQRIILQDGRDLMTLALLDRDNPFQRVVAWNNLAKKQDVSTWEMLKQRWPQSTTILDMGFSDKGNIDLESVLSRQPDLMIAQLRAKPALTEGGVISKLAASTCLARCSTARARPKPIPITIVSICRLFSRERPPSRRKLWSLLKP